MRFWRMSNKITSLDSRIYRSYYKIMKTKNKSELYLSMDSPVYLIEKKNGKQVSQDPIDSGVVLQLLMHAIEEGIDMLEKNDLPKKRTKKLFSSKKRVKNA